MKSFEFYWLLIENFPVYILIYLIIFVAYYKLFYKYIFSIFDPFFFESIVSSSFATSTVLFLYFFNTYKSIYLINYLLSIFAFWGVFLLFAKKVKKAYSFSPKNCKNKISKKIKLPHSFFVFFFVLSFLNILYNLYIYTQFGIPLFMESRLTINMHGGIVNGLLARLQLLFSTLSTLMLFYVLVFYRGSKQLYGKFYLCIIVLFAFLSGSRATLFSYLFVFSTFVYFNQKTWNKGVVIFTSKKIILFSFLLASSGLVVIIIQNSSDILVSFLHLFLRFASYGDAYAYGFPHDNLLKVEVPSFHQFLIGDLLSTFRINPLERITIGYGYELKSIAENVSNSVTGPNPRVNLVGYSYFGFWGNIVLAGLSGFIFVMIRNVFIASVDFNVSKQLISYYFYLIFKSIESDILLIIVNITTNFLLQFFLFFTIYMVINYSRKVVCVRSVVE